MRRAARFLIRLYPASWRERYGEEFQALVEDSSPSFSVFFDLITGAIKMRLTTPSFPKLALMLSIAGLLAGWGISFLVTPTYVSTATLQIVPKLVPDSISQTTRNQQLSERIGQMQQEILSRTSLASMITDARLDLYREERARQPLEDVIEKMRTRDIRITIASLPGERRATAFMISFAYRDRTKAHDTVQTLITRFQEANLTSQRNQQNMVRNFVNQRRTPDQVDKLEARIAVLEKRLGIPPTPPEPLDQFVPALAGENLDVLDPPNLPLHRAKPNRYSFASLGFGSGFIAALIVAIFRRPVRPRDIISGSARMRVLARFMTCLYPAAWRQRYGDEVQALLEDRPPTLSTLFDLMKGATKMHLSVPAFPKLALLLSVAGMMLAGWGISFLVTPSYVSQSTLIMDQRPGSAPADLRPAIGALQQQILSRTSLSAIITDPRLEIYRSERNRQPLEDVIETMRNRDLHFSPAGTSDAFTVSFTYSDPQKAHDTVQTVITKFQEANLQRQRVPTYVKRQRTYDQIDRMEARIAALEKRLGIPPSATESLDELVPVSDRITLDVLDPPSLPINPAKPNRYIFASFGFGAGFIAALIVVIFRRPVRPAMPFPAQPA